MQCDRYDYQDEESILGIFPTTLDCGQYIEYKPEICTSGIFSWNLENGECKCCPQPGSLYYNNSDTDTYQMSIVFII